MSLILSPVRARRAAYVMLLLAATLLLTSCRTDLDTTIRVSGEGAIEEVAAALRLTGAAADAAADATIDQQLRDIFTQRVGTAPTVEVSDGERTYTVVLPADRVSELADLTGVHAATASRDGDRVRAEVHVAAPITVLQALAAYEDEAVAAASATTLFVTVDVLMPGQVLQVDMSSVDGEALSELVAVETNGRTASLSAPSADLAPSVLTVVSETGNKDLPVVVGGVALLIGLVVLLGVRYR